MIDRPSKPSSPESQKSEGAKHFYDEGEDFPVQDGDLEEAPESEDANADDFSQEQAYQEQGISEEEDAAIDDNGDYTVDDENPEEGEDGSAEGDDQYYVQEQFEPVPEKTFLQKYFTPIAVGGVVIFLGGAFYFQFKDSLFKSSEPAPAPLPVLEKIVTPSAAQKDGASSSAGSLSDIELFPSSPSKRPVLSEKEPPRLDDLPSQESQTFPSLVKPGSVQDESSSASSEQPSQDIAAQPSNSITPTIAPPVTENAIEPTVTSDLPVSPEPVSSPENLSELGTFAPPPLEQQPVTPSPNTPPAFSNEATPATIAQNQSNATSAPTVIAENGVALEKSMDDLRMAIEGLQQKLAVLEVSPASDAAGQGQLKETVAQLQQAIDDLKTLKTQAAPAPRTAPPAPQKKTSKTAKATKAKPAIVKTSASPWILRSATYGQAWVVHKTSNIQRRVVPGDTIEGVGRIISVEKEAGQWTVNATGGKIH